MPWPSAGRTAHRPQVGEDAEALPQRQQPGLGPGLARRSVHRRIAHRTQEHGVGTRAPRRARRGGRGAPAARDGGAADEMRNQLHLPPEPVGDGVEHPRRLVP